MIDENYHDDDTDEFDGMNPEDFNFLIYVTEMLQEAVGEKSIVEMVKGLKEHKHIEDFYLSEVDLYGIKTDLNQEGIAAYGTKYIRRKVNVKKIFIVLFLSVVYISANVLTPVQEISVNGTTKDMVLRDKELLIGTDNGVLQVYDYEAKVFSYTIVLPPVKDFVGDIIPPRVFSVDKIDDRYLLVSDSGKGGYANLWIHENNVNHPTSKPYR